MGKVYRSKVDLWLVLLIIAFVFIVTAPALLLAFSWVALGSVLMLCSFIFYVFASTRYEIEEETLSIKCGFFLNEKIHIKDIVRIRSTRSFISAPASSLDRIEIYISKQRSPIIISPRNKHLFIDSLKVINPDIVSEI